MPATPRAVGMYVRGLGLHRPATDFEAAHRRRSLGGSVPDGAVSTSMHTAVSAPRQVLDSSKRTVLFVASGTLISALAAWVFFSGPPAEEMRSPGTNPPPRATNTIVAAPPPVPAPPPTNPPMQAASTAPVQDALVVEKAPAPSAVPMATTTWKATATGGAKKQPQPIKKTNTYEPRGL